MPVLGTPLSSMPDEVRELARPWRTLVGVVPDLTEELEQEFRFGQQVIDFGGVYRLGGNIKGGSSSMWIPCSRHEWDAYCAWQRTDGIPESEDRAAYEALEAILAVAGVDLVNGNYSSREQEEHRYSKGRGYVYAMMARMFDRLPRAHLSRGEFKVLQVGGWGPDCAKGSSYEDGTVSLYNFAVGGARRSFLGLFLHELGHVHESAMPRGLFDDLSNRFSAIARAKAVVGVEYLLDAETRRTYQIRFFREFLAETYMIYTSQGTRLREFIAQQGGEVRAVWDSVYDAFRSGFEGMEYE